jgi:hypothetical protein
MQDESSTKEKRRFRFMPKRPRVKLRSDLRADEQFRSLRDGMRIHHACPHDGAAMQLQDVFPTDENGEISQGTEPMRALVCPECSFTVPVAVLAEKLRREAEPLKRAERQFTLFGFGLLALFGVIALVNGNVLTIVGALLLSLTLFLKALFYRYRYWQAETGQMFLDRPPISAWLRDEFSKKPAG